MKKNVLSVMMITVLFALSYILAGVYAKEIEQLKTELFAQGDFNAEKAILLYEKNEKISSEKKIELYARAAALMDADSGRILYGKDAFKQLPMASTTKIMSCIVILEEAELSDVVTISKNAAKQPDVQLNALEGEQYYVKDLLYALMLESHNDVAVALAEHVGGSVEGFAKMMNEKATSLGCANTHFVTPNGLDADGHYTTASDLCKIAAYSLKNETFVQIINTPSYQFQEITSGKNFQVSNKDRFLSMYEGALGVKTGFTGNAGYCFVGAAKRRDMTLVSAVLGSGWPPNKNYKWADTKALMDYGYDNFEKRECFLGEFTLPFFSVICGKKKEIKIEGEFPHKLLVGDGSESEKIVLLKKQSVQAPIKKGQQVAVINYYFAGKKIDSYPVIASESVAQADYFLALTKVFHCLLARAN